MLYSNGSGENIIMKNVNASLYMIYFKKVVVHLN